MAIQMNKRRMYLLLMRMHEIEQTLEHTKNNVYLVSNYNFYNELSKKSYYRRYHRS
jgi:hypothetical protein